MYNFDKERVQVVKHKIKKGDDFGMIIKSFNLGNTKILVDDTYLPKSEEENQLVYEEFNRIGCKILYSQQENEK